MKHITHLKLVISVASFFPILKAKCDDFCQVPFKQFYKQMKVSQTRSGGSYGTRKRVLSSAEIRVIEETAPKMIRQIWLAIKKVEKSTYASGGKVHIETYTLAARNDLKKEIEPIIRRRFADMGLADTSALHEFTYSVLHSPAIELRTEDDLLRMFYNDLQYHWLIESY